MTFFDNRCAEIEAEYGRLGHKIGWRFLSGPKANLNRTTQVAFITLNPGGRNDPPDHPHESQERGSAYLIESWDGRPAGQSNLQIQVGAMFKLLADRLNVGDYKTLMNETLMGYFIPFRSPNYASLTYKPESVVFAEQLWSGVFDQIAPKTVITMDTLTFKHVRKIVADRHPDKTERHIQVPTGWGNYQADIVQFGLPDDGLTLVRVPHLSRFGIFTSAKCRAEVVRLMTNINRISH